MKKLILITITFFVIASCKPKNDFVAPTLHKEMDSVSYAIGIQMGENLKQNGIDSTLNLDLLTRGVYETLNNKEALFDEGTIKSILMKQFYPLAYAATQQENNTNSTFHCSVCGKLINGSGYEEVSNGVWEPCNSPYQCQICSPECGMKHTNEMNGLMDKVDESSGIKCSTCGFGHYVNGYCNYCSAASQSTLDRHQANYPVCPLCRGTGIEKPVGANSFGETGRICPMCDGKGRQTY